MFPTLRRFLGVVAAGVLGSLLSGAAMATLVTQTLVHAGGSTWTASFSVANDGSPAAIESFTIYLPVGQASNLVMTGSPAEWDSLVVQPDQALGADGFFDALLIDPSGAITPGLETGGFSVQFDWGGTGGPGLFEFTVNDPVTFDVVEAGRAVAAPGTPSPVPEPAALGLILVALAAVGVVRHRRGT